MRTVLLGSLIALLAVMLLIAGWRGTGLDARIDAAADHEPDGAFRFKAGIDLRIATGSQSQRN